MAMVLTPQKPTQRKRFGELPAGLPGSTLARGMRGEERQELGRPVRFLRREGHVVGHTDIEPRQGRPGHGSRPEPTRHGPPQQVSNAEQKRGKPKTQRESDPPILLRDGSAVYTGKGRTVLRSLHRKH